MKKMKLERTSKQRMIGKAIYGILIFVSVACTTKKEAKPVKETVAPIAVEKTAVVKESTEVLDIVTYGVQIGAYKNFDVQFNSNIQNIQKNGLSHYILGSFSTLKEAKDFLKIMQDLNVKDAFVVTLKNGEIIE